MSTSPVRRRLAAIMSVEVVSNAAMLGGDEAGVRQRLDAYRGYMDNSIRAFDGRVANPIGEGFLAEFASPVQAVRCAVEIQDNVAALNAKLPVERHMRFRVGVHVDDVIVQPNGDLIGEGVNVAARLQTAAEPGGIGVSGDIVAQVRTRLAEFAFPPMSETRLKALQTLQAFQVVRDQSPRAQLAPAEPPPVAAVAATPSRPSFLARHRVAIAFCLGLLVAGGGAGGAVLLLREPPVVVAERTAWTALAGRAGIAELEGFLASHPDGAFGGEARARLAALRQQEAAERQQREDEARLAREAAAREVAARETAAREAAARQQREEEERVAAAAQLRARDASGARRRMDSAVRPNAAAPAPIETSRRRDDIDRRRAAAEEREKRLAITRYLDWKPVACAQSRLASTAGLTCSVSPVYEGADGTGKFRRWAAATHGTGLSTYIILVEAADAASTHDPLSRDDEEAFLFEISDYTRLNAAKWEDMAISPTGFVQPFVTFDKRNCAAFSRSGPARGAGIAWAMRGYVCAPGGQALPPEQFRTIVEAQRVN